MTGAHPVDAAIAACAPLRLAPAPSLGDPPTASGDDEPVRWFRGDLLAAAVPELYAETTAVHGPHHRTTGALHLAREMLRDLTYFTVASLRLAGVGPDLSADRIWLRWNEGVFDQRRLDRSAPAATTDLRHADRPCALVVADESALWRWTAERYVATYAPLLEAVRATSRVGERLLWGYVADAVQFRMLMVARDVGADMAAAWRDGERFVETLRAAGAPIRTRPRPFPLESLGPDKLWAVRGVCCFDYKEDAEHGYCVTCPLNDDAARWSRFEELVALGPTG